MFSLHLVASELIFLSDFLLLLGFVLKHDFSGVFFCPKFGATTHILLKVLLEACGLEHSIALTAKSYMPQTLQRLFMCPSRDGSTFWLICNTSVVTVLPHGNERADLRQISRNLEPLLAC